MNNLIPIYKKQLDLHKAEFCRIDHGDTMVAVVYKITESSKQPLILKICTREEDYYRELYFLNHLAEALPVPRVLEVVEPKPGIAGAILMECLEGRLLQTEDWSDTLAYELGSILAQLHLNRTKGYGDLTKPQILTDSAITYFEQKFNEELAECTPHLPEKTIEQCLNFFNSHRKLLASVDGPCMVHRDFRPGNIIVCDGKLKGIIDWAGGRSGFAEQDIYPMEHSKWPNQPTHKKALLSGYSSIRPLPELNEIMPLLQLGRALAVIGFTVKSGTWNGKNMSIYQYNRRFLDKFSFAF